MARGDHPWKGRPVGINLPSTVARLLDLEVERRELIAEMKSALLENACKEGKVEKIKPAAIPGMRHRSKYDI